jgi:hypothetical protein
MQQCPLGTGTDDGSACAELAISHLRPSTERRARTDDGRHPGRSAERIRQFGRARVLQARPSLSGLGHAANRRSGSRPVWSGAAVGRVIYDEPAIGGSGAFRIRPSSEGTNRKRFPCSTPDRLGLCRLLQEVLLVVNRCTSRRADHASPGAPTRRVSRCVAPLTARATEF